MYNCAVTCTITTIYTNIFFLLILFSFAYTSYVHRKKSGYINNLKNIINDTENINVNVMK